MSTDSVRELGPWSLLLDRNSVSLNIFGLLAGTFYTNYEWFAPDGLVGFKVPLIIGLSGNPNNYFIGNIYKNAVTGVECNIYPTRQGRVRMYAGPAFKTGLVSYEKNRYLWNITFYAHLANSKNQVC